MLFKYALDTDKGEHLEYIKCDHFHHTVCTDELMTQGEEGVTLSWSLRPELGCNQSHTFSAI